jgi:hypothetical protein
VHLGALRLQCLCSRCREVCAAALLHQDLFCTKEQYRHHHHHLSSSSSRHLVVASSPPLFLSSGETFGLDRQEFLGRIQRLRRIPPKKIGHIRRELGLPDEFRMNLVKKYPQYMRVVETERFCFGAHSIGSSPGHNCLGNVHARESGSKEGAGRGAFQETGRSARSNCESPEVY